jgi:hypothetical protein
MIENRYREKDHAQTRAGTIFAIAQQETVLGVGQKEDVVELSGVAASAKPASEPRLVHPGLAKTAPRVGLPPEARLSIMFGHNPLSRLN